MPYWKVEYSLPTASPSLPCGCAFFSPTRSTLYLYHPAINRPLATTRLPFLSSALVHILYFSHQLGFFFLNIPAMVTFGFKSPSLCEHGRVHLCQRNRKQRSHGSKVIASFEPQLAKTAQRVTRWHHLPWPHLGREGGWVQVTFSFSCFFFMSIWGAKLGLGGCKEGCSGW